MTYRTRGDEFMSEKKVSKEDLLHIAKLADLKIKDDEVDKYLENLQEILNFADVINNADVSNLDITIGAYENTNVFRKDEVKEFGDLKALLQNAPEQDQNMFKIPKVIN